MICSYTIPKTKAAFQASPCMLQKLCIASDVYHYSCHVPCKRVLASSEVACSKLALASTASPVQDLTNWEVFRRTKRQKCWRAFPCSALAASGILPWPVSTLQVGLHLIHVVNSPRCIHLDAFTWIHSLICIQQMRLR